MYYLCNFGKIFEVYLVDDKNTKIEYLGVLEYMHVNTRMHIYTLSEFIWDLTKYCEFLEQYTYHRPVIQYKLIEVQQRILSIKMEAIYDDYQYNRLLNEYNILESSRKKLLKMFQTHKEKSQKKMTLQCEEHRIRSEKEECLLREEEKCLLQEEERKRQERERQEEERNRKERKRQEEERYCKERKRREEERKRREEERKRQEEERNRKERERQEEEERHRRELQHRRDTVYVNTVLGELWDKDDHGICIKNTPSSDQSLIYGYTSDAYDVLQDTLNTHRIVDSYFESIECFTDT